MKLSHLVAALAYVGAAFVFGMALGERGELGLVQSIFALVIPLSTVILAILAKRNRLLVFLTGTTMFGGLLLGQRRFEAAWNECVFAGYAVHARITDHRLTHGDYPARLTDLEGELPCRCALRQTILHYLSNDRGFRLWITSDRRTIVFTATGTASSPPPR